MVSMERIKQDKNSHCVKDFFRFSSLNFFRTILYFTAIIYPGNVSSNACFGIFDIVLFLCPSVEQLTDRKSEYLTSVGKKVVSGILGSSYSLHQQIPNCCWCHSVFYCLLPCALLPITVCSVTKYSVFCCLLLCALLPSTVCFVAYYCVLCYLVQCVLLNITVCSVTQYSVICCLQLCTLLISTACSVTYTTVCFVADYCVLCYLIQCVLLPISVCSVTKYSVICCLLLCALLPSTACSVTYSKYSVFCCLLLCALLPIAQCVLLPLLCCANTTSAALNNDGAVAFCQDGHDTCTIINNTSTEVRDCKPHDGYATQG